MAREPLTIDLTRRGASLFLRQLASDDSFRRRLRRNPRRALAEHGISVPEALLPSEISLPSKAELRGLEDYLAGRPNPKPPAAPPEFPCLWLGLALLARAARQAGRPKK